MKTCIIGNFNIKHFDYNEINSQHSWFGSTFNSLTLYHIFPHFKCIFLQYIPSNLSIWKQSGILFIRPIPLNTLTDSYHNAIKFKTVFPTNDRLLKMPYLFTINIIDITKMGGDRQDDGQIHSKLEIYFEKNISFRNIKRDNQRTVSTYTMLTTCTAINA